MNPPNNSNRSVNLEQLERITDRITNGAPLKLDQLDLTINHPETTANNLEPILPYFHRTEGEVSKNDKEISALVPHIDEHIVRFRKLWVAEEKAHSDIEGFWSTRLGLPLDTIDDKVGWKFRLAGAISHIKNLRAKDVFTQLYLDTGGRNEKTVTVGYPMLAGRLRQIDEEPMAQVIDQITRQEFAHLSFYIMASRYNRQKLSPAQKYVVEAMEINTATPVGAGGEANQLAFARAIQPMIKGDLEQLVKPVQELAKRLLYPVQEITVDQPELIEKTLAARALVRVIHKLTAARDSGRTIDNFMIKAFEESLSRLAEDDQVTAADGARKSSSMIQNYADTLTVQARQSAVT